MHLCLKIPIKRIIAEETHLTLFVLTCIMEDVGPHLYGIAYTVCH
jgi:hypothetical protein